MIENFLYLIGFSISLLVLYRSHGGGIVNLPWKTAEILIASVLGVAAWQLTHEWSAAAITAMFALSKIVGHGQYMTLNFDKSLKYIEPESLDWFVKPLFGEDPRSSDRAKLTQGVGKTTRRITINNLIEIYGRSKLYLRCLFGLGVTNLIVASGLIVALATSGSGMFLEAAIVFVGFFIAKPLAYMLGWKIHPDAAGSGPEDFDEATEIGEGLTGFISGLVLALLFILQ